MFSIGLLFFLSLSLCAKQDKQLTISVCFSFLFSFSFLFFCFKFISQKHFCGVVAEAYESKSNILYIRFFATGPGIKSEFSFLYTAFTKKKAVDGKNTTLACAKDEFDCDDETCIDIELKCDTVNNCKFKKDEAGCDVCIECVLTF